MEMLSGLLFSHKNLTPRIIFHRMHLIVTLQVLSNNSQGLVAIGTIFIMLHVLAPSFVCSATNKEMTL